MKSVTIKKGIQAEIEAIVGILLIVAAFCHWSCGGKQWAIRFAAPTIFIDYMGFGWFSHVWVSCASFCNKCRVRLFLEDICHNATFSFVRLSNVQKLGSLLVSFLFILSHLKWFHQVCHPLSFFSHIYSSQNQILINFFYFQLVTSVALFICCVITKINM